MSNIEQLDFPHLYEKCLLIRKTEEILLDLFSKGKLNGTVHTCVGQEIIPVCLSEIFSKEEIIIFGNHRSHGHYIAFRENIISLINEILGSKKGLCKGIGGSQHLHDYLFFTNGVQGGIVANAVGSALASKLLNDKYINIVFLGDGTMGEGLVYESLNFASKNKLKILFVIEDNEIAQTTEKKVVHIGNFLDIFKAFNIQGDYVDSKNIVELIEKIKSAKATIVEKNEPFVLHIKSYRLKPHSKGDDTRTNEKIMELTKSDPLIKLKSYLTSDEQNKIENKITEYLNTILKECDAVEYLSQEELNYILME